MSEDAWRLFCAIETSEELRQQVSKHIRRLREKHNHIRASWVTESNLHLTIKFIGNVPLQNVDILTSAAARAVNELRKFNIASAGTGVFPRSNSPRVLWIGINDPSGELAQLYARLEKECVTAGFQPEDRSFKPHLTLARVREPNQARALALDHLQSTFKPIELPVSELLVVRSQMSNKGSTYTVISRHPLIS
ncbi:MAG TPA: RNA 2',3'-cyclic phosphodiesterase [Pyrinomonadaceae bacterium]|nr:RNA 2',3'-cyclic phosphodiesterase [Pyrinomonadaceae bacterium]